MKKNLILALVMCLILLMTFGGTANAVVAHRHAPCGGSTCANHSSHTEHTYLPVEDSSDLRLVTGDNYYYLSQDITLTGRIRQRENPLFVPAWL